MTTYIDRITELRIGGMSVATAVRQWEHEQDRLSECSFLHADTIPCPTCHAPAGIRCPRIVKNTYHRARTAAYVADFGARGLADPTVCGLCSRPPGRNSCFTEAGLLVCSRCFLADPHDRLYPDCRYTVCDVWRHASILLAVDADAVIEAAAG